ncbi:MAG: toll/interleukin-1 receptor domain-containing protein [Flavobacteriaceae bacterium]|nr:toll/interleukin-1 receptor domain-containing protein [Flavobacteriaceae bacterium]
MKYKYQLIMLGSDVNEKQLILTQIYTEFNHLKLSEEFLKIIDAKSIDTEYLGNQPAFALYFGDVDGNFHDLDITKKLLEDGTMILPIYFNEFNSDIPEILSNQNSIQYKKAETNKITNIVLEAFELLRNTRKIFISYRRTESTSVAIQLYEALEANNFDVFLDTHSVQKGEPFQDELWHRMTDCDVMVLLNTPGFLKSHWCKEEFAEAAAKQIGVVQLTWPKYEFKSIDKTSHISYPIQLKKDDFIGGVYDNSGKFTEDFIERLIQTVDSVRARNLAARQESLIIEFRNIAKKNERTINLQPEKILTEDLPNGQHIIYIPTIGIPQSINFQRAEVENKECLGNKVSMRLIYDDLRIRNYWLEHLEWLNDSLNKDIKTLKKQSFEQWLRAI